MTQGDLKKVTKGEQSYVSFTFRKPVLSPYYYVLDPIVRFKHLTRLP